jgi:hypothetical protein
MKDRGLLQIGILATAIAALCCFTPASLDWVHRRLPSLLVWKLPAAVLVASALLELSARAPGVVWALAFATMGLGCARNALRCGR